MKWGVRKDRKSSGRRRSGDIRVEKGENIHRIIPKTWFDREKDLSGHAYASYKKSDVERYKHFARLFGGGDNYIDMNMKVKEALVSPSKKKRVDEFVKMMSTNQSAKQAMIKATRSPISFMPKKRLERLDDPKQRAKAYEKFSYLLVSKPDLRDPYFKQLKQQGYSMIVDDADIKSGLSKSPVIVFDRKQSLRLESASTIGDK